MIDVTMPRFGETVNDATISQWLKAVGDRVEAGEPILEVSTDKVDAEVEAPSAGWISELLAKVDDVVEVGGLIARISETAP
ncbi:MAG TPA: biotin/lipoyl-containing protein [Streptosporangiaceae bacterium]|jgi:2-oxoglutarate dehydrogenase E2 component (dihydrolipoamide succinyltransferase)|nr:biotin/lipoyl-containing protein [Streptosporangiaceae bacterium]